MAEAEADLAPGGDLPTPGGDSPTPTAGATYHEAPRAQTAPRPARCRSQACGAPPRLWLLASPHAGDNSQLLALAEALGWPFAVKRLAYRAAHHALRMIPGSGLPVLDRARSSDLAPPWPDLVLAAARESEPVALDLRRRAGGRTRLVHVGSPWAPPGRYDLVIATPQYRLPGRPNVLQNELPLHRAAPAALAEAGAAWWPLLARLPRPWVALLVGGPSGPYGLDAAAGARLGRAASAAAAGGALLVSTSARTPAATADALAAALAVPAHLFRWRPGVAGNPYLAYLALADRFIVTADSVSMIAEACATGRPVALFDTEEGRRAMRAEAAAPDAALPPPHWRGADLNATLWRLLLRTGPVRAARDLRIVHRRLAAAGRVHWLGEPAPPPAPASDDLARAVARIRELLDR
jgi:mitochondrial fission protein ELM1